MKSNDESAGETGAENIEIGQLSVPSNAVGKTNSRTSNASVSDDGVVHSKVEDRRIPQGHDDWSSRISGTDQHANIIYDTGGSMMRYNKPSKISEEMSDKVPSRSLRTGLHSQNSGVLKSTDVATGLLKVQNTSSQASDLKYVSHDQNPRDVKDGKTSAVMNELLEDLSQPWDSLSPTGVTSDIVRGYPPATAFNSIQKNDDMEVDIQPIDETDDSDMMEQDVKVCDICGDAGREDLLAVCCQCSDGAEHTYCMREMRAEVPEGEWLCEECQALEHLGNGKEEKIRRTGENEKNNSGHTSSEYMNNSDVEGQRTKGFTRIPSKRQRCDGDAEVSSTVKKPALDSKVGSLGLSNSGKTAALTRESSLRNLDKGMLQFSEIVPDNDTSESASSASDPRVHSLRGTFSKSSSFSSLNSKPKVKLVDQVVIQRRKSAKEPSSFRRKEGVVRSIGKSMSFKSTNSARSESKVKMLSPRLSHIQDIKNTKQRSPFERQHSFRTERSSINLMTGTSVSSTSGIDKRPVSPGEPSSLVTIANQHEVKPVLADNKSAALSRSSSLAARKTADLSSFPGEFKRLLLHGHCTFGISSANGVHNNEHDYNQTSLMEDSFCSVVSERPALNADKGVPDGSPHHKDLTNSGEQMKECSGSRSGPPTAKSSRDEGDNLKAAIEAAVLRKPGVCWKHRTSGQSDDSSLSSLGCEVASHQDPISSSARNEKFSDAVLPGKPMVSRNLPADSLKQETSNLVKQSSLVPVEGLSSGRGDGVHISSSRDMLSNVPAAMPFFLKSVAVPEHEYIWQGSFEICRSGKAFDSWGGIQAHLSSCASPKVTEAVNKLKSRILLHEVPRLSTWPKHFQEHGVREDNIAIFFFAKDLESYDKIYKVLLDNMMMNDLALKGNVNDVELLIFPSTQLPDNSKRWNMLFFLWGVFRRKKGSCQQQMPESLKQFCAPHSIPPPVMSLPESRCSLRPISKVLHENKNAAVSEELQQLLSSRVANRDSGAKSLNRLIHQLNSSSLPAVQSDNANHCQETTGVSQEGDMSSNCSPPPLGTGRRSSSGMLMQLDESCKQNQVKSSRVDGKALEKDHRDPRWLFNHNVSMLPRNLQVPLGNDDTCEEKNYHECDESASEKCFFPAESQSPWKFLEQQPQDRVNDRAPDLELALGAAERKSPTLEATPPPPPPPLGLAVGSKVDEAEDDVAAASLSLSLSFPFNL